LGHHVNELFTVDDRPLDREWFAACFTDPPTTGATGRSATSPPTSASSMKDNLEEVGQVLIGHGKEGTRQYYRGGSTGASGNHLGRPVKLQPCNSERYLTILRAQTRLNRSKIRTAVRRHRAHILFSARPRG